MQWNIFNLLINPSNFRWSLNQQNYSLHWLVNEQSNTGAQVNGFLRKNARSLHRNEITQEQRMIYFSFSAAWNNPKVVWMNSSADVLEYANTGKIRTDWGNFKLLQYRSLRVNIKLESSLHLGTRIIFEITESRQEEGSLPKWSVKINHFQLPQIIRYQDMFGLFKIINDGGLWLLRAKVNWLFYSRTKRKFKTGTSVYISWSKNVFPLDKYFKSILDRKNPANSKISSEEKKPWFQFDFVSFDFFF